MPLSLYNFLHQLPKLMLHMLLHWDFLSSFCLCISNCLTDSIIFPIISSSIPSDLLLPWIILSHRLIGFFKNAVNWQTSSSAAYCFGQLVLTFWILYYFSVFSSTFVPNDFSWNNFFSIFTSLSYMALLTIPLTDALIPHQFSQTIGNHFLCSLDLHSSINQPTTWISQHRQH